MHRILIVEDNELNRDMLGRRLKRKGYDVGFAADGQVAVQIAYHHKPDLILMDMSLPVKDGWTATYEIKSMAETQAIPIIALTAHAMESDRERAFQVGCNEFETKPIQLPSLLRKMDLLLGMGEEAVA